MGLGALLKKTGRNIKKEAKKIAAKAKKETRKVTAQAKKGLVSAVKARRVNDLIRQVVLVIVAVILALGVLYLLYRRWLRRYATRVVATSPPSPSSGYADSTD
jgi:hypothetical protein